MNKKLHRILIVILIACGLLDIFTGVQTRVYDIIGGFFIGAGLTFAIVEIRDAILGADE